MEVEEKQEKTERFFEYRNVTKIVNAFTSKGRVMPGETVKLTAKEGKQYYGVLERCRST